MVNPKKILKQITSEFEIILHNKLKPLFFVQCSTQGPIAHQCLIRL